MTMMAMAILVMPFSLQYGGSFRNQARYPHIAVSFSQIRSETRALCNRISSLSQPFPLARQIISFWRCEHYWTHSLRRSFSILHFRDLSVCFLSPFWMTLFLSVFFSFHEALLLIPPFLSLVFHVVFHVSGNLSFRSGDTLAPRNETFRRGSLFSLSLSLRETEDFSLFSSIEQLSTSFPLRRSSTEDRRCRLSSFAH